jgi:hypothetical protein
MLLIDNIVILLSITGKVVWWNIPPLTSLEDFINQGYMIPSLPGQTFKVQSPGIESNSWRRSHIHLCPIPRRFSTTSVRQLRTVYLTQFRGMGPGSMFHHFNFESTTSDSGITSLECKFVCEAPNGETPIILYYYAGQFCGADTYIQPWKTDTDSALMLTVSTRCRGGTWRSDSVNAEGQFDSRGHDNRVRKIWEMPPDLLPSESPWEFDLCALAGRCCVVVDMKVYIMDY